MPHHFAKSRFSFAAAAFCGALLLSFATGGPVEAEQYDVVVYGGTSAAVTAAVEAARMGKSVVIVSPEEHLGGLTSNGLGWTDIGSRDSIGGLSREFYHRVYEHYLQDEAWTLETRHNYTNRSSLDPDANREMMFTFEPKVAEQIFDDLIAEHNIPVVTGHLDRANGVAMYGQNVTSIRTVQGGTFVGKAFIDATYEGDLMAAAGVSYTVGREANSQYGESLNGVQTVKTVKNQLPSGIDPYLVQGDPSSGLLPGVNATAGGPDGTGDQRLQAYNYRMVLTNNPANRAPISQPDNYNEADYELLFRAIEVGQTSRFFKLSPMPNNKTDSNNDSGISTDFIGGNYNLETGVNYAEADYATREQMDNAHRDFQLGYVWTLQNHPRVPAAIRDAWDDWGLALDEFTDNGNWPREIYVREARRMVSDFVITERHVNQEAGFEQTNSIGMGGYNMDSHNAQRYVDENGYVRNEGDLQVAPANGPYPISYDAMVPRADEATNLLVPVAVSASHIAYGSLRMEPVFMTLGQSAGAAASLISERSIAAQDLPYSLLRSRLVRGRQVLGEGYVSSDPGILLNFGDTVLDDHNSPGHLLGGTPGVAWNVITGDTPNGIVDSTGQTTSLSIDLGKSSPAVQTIDWNASGYSTLSSGSDYNTDIYSGNAGSALFVSDGKDSQVDLGVRIGGLGQGTFDVFLSTKNTNTSNEERYHVYFTTVDGLVD
ncbi:FAD-dependent oxidoreductase [Aeoliella mucimassa]|uniref:FAD dependent oxidoreductase n=1 Tax=Aeoliella mucimassa TaxID=2527972 RepID=A0A518AGR7_9BACT|nr:FAD-dependent oxidoreductase [Aeoliella mucimassa]QDU53904.1 FAD dependent oxidoreductase [Aeoliella mucimassa]